jgi:hypothetical protein
MLTQEATSTRLISEIISTSQRLQSGDFLLITYAGHGGTTPDTTGEENDGRDETWCLYDRMVLDDELFRCWSEFKPGVNILVVADSCHSGTSTRVAITKRSHIEANIGKELFRCLPSHICDIVFSNNELLYKSLKLSIKREIVLDVKANVLLLAACQDDQLSSDGNKSNGLYTEKLLEVWNGGRFNKNHKAFLDAISALMPDDERPNYFWATAPDIIFESAVPFTLGNVQRDMRTGELNGKKIKWELEIDSSQIRSMPLDYLKYKLEQEVPGILMASYQEILNTQEQLVFARGGRGEIEVGCTKSDKGWECGVKAGIKF